MKAMVSLVAFVLSTVSVLANGLGVVAVYETAVNYGVKFGDQAVVPTKGYAIVGVPPSAPGKSAFASGMGYHVVYWEMKATYVDSKGKTVTVKSKLYSTDGFALYIPSGTPTPLVPFQILYAKEGLAPSLDLLPVSFGNYASLYFFDAIEYLFDYYYPPSYLYESAMASGRLGRNGAPPATMRGIATYGVGPDVPIAKEVEGLFEDDVTDGVGYGSSAASYNSTFSSTESTVDDVLTAVVEDLESRGYIPFNE